MPPPVQQVAQTACAPHGASPHRARRPGTKAAVVVEALGRDPAPRVEEEAPVAPVQSRLRAPDGARVERVGPQAMLPRERSGFRRDRRKALDAAADGGADQEVQVLARFESAIEASDALPVQACLVTA
jgi:hypothetical protein